LYLIWVFLGVKLIPPKAHFLSLTLVKLAIIRFSSKSPTSPLGHPKQSQGFSMTSIQQRAALQSQIWKIANDVRGAVDGWDFKQYVLGTLFYRFISEKILRPTLRRVTTASNPRQLHLP